jgi:glycosyltransferase involved in cell wall biosynthesis
MSTISEAPPSAGPKISVISFCLNSAEFLRETIESVLGQAYENYEFIIKDGGSTDGTIEILKEYPRIHWVSEKEGGDNPTLDAIWQAFEMSSGEYIIFLAISDGFVDRQWFKRCVEALDADPEISWVWGLSQNMMENGEMGKVWYAEFLEQHPPQKMDFLPFWLATGHGMECNACFRRSVFEICFPRNSPEEPFRFHAALGFNYELNTRGYLPFFIPTVSYFGRVHGHQRQEDLYELLDSICKQYFRDIAAYRSKLLAGRNAHRFRDGASKVIHEVASQELWHYRRKILNYRIKAKLRRDLQKLLEHIVY